MSLIITPPPITVTAGSGIIDTAGNIWSIVSGQVAVNASIDKLTANVVAIAYDGTLVYQVNSAGGVWSKISPAAAWIASKLPAIP